MRDPNTKIGRLRRLAADDSGMALMMVVTVSAIMFVLLMGVLSVATYHQIQTSRYTKRTQAMHLADAGLNEYLYQLSQKGSIYGSENPVVGPISMEDGTWTVYCTPAQDDEPIKLRAVGVLKSGEASRTIHATVRWPSFADYAVLDDEQTSNGGSGTYSIGSGATFYGKVRTNANISNAGTITGLAISGGSCTGSGKYLGGKWQNAPKVNFATLTADLLTLRQTATASNTYLPPAGTYYDVVSKTTKAYLGYKLVFAGNSITVEKVKTEETTNLTGALTTDPQPTLTIPASGVIFVDDMMWVSGNYGSKVTVASSEKAKLWDDLVPTDPNGKATMGVIAGTNVEVMWWYDAMPEVLDIQAATLAQTGWVGAPSETDSGKTITGQPLKSTINLTGARAMLFMKGFTNGFTARNFYYDPRLELVPPPMFPTISGDPLKVSTWLES